MMEDHNGEMEVYSNEQYPILGRRIATDERDQQYPMRPQATTPQERDALNVGYRYWWQDGWWGDQWYTPQCVAYAWTHWAEDGPITQVPRKPNRVSVHGQGNAIINPQEAYDWCQRNDEWPYENYDGTSVRAGAKYLRERGLIKEFHWARDIDTVVKAILTEAPVVVGTNWSESMMEVDEEGMIHYNPSTPVYGHAYLLNGVSKPRGIIRIKNSWGRQWGDEGTAEISITDMEQLLRDRGEACLAVEVEA